MMADSASHLVRHPISFELFLLLYLVSALLLQKINIYKTNYHRVDTHIVVFLVVVLGRRLAWCSLHLIRTPSRVRGQLHLRLLSWKSLFSDYFRNGLTRNGLWTLLTWNWSMNVKRLCVGLVTIPPMLWAVFCLTQNTSIFNMLFLFYPLLLYFSLFGFTLEPRCYRGRFEPPKKFLEHTNLMSPTAHQSFSPIFAASSVEFLAPHGSNQGHIFNPQPHHSMSASSGNSSPAHQLPRVRHRAEKLDGSSYSSNIIISQQTYRSYSSQQQQQQQHSRPTFYRDRPTDPSLSSSSSLPSSSYASSSSASKKGHVSYTNGRIYSGKASVADHSRLHGKSHSSSVPVYMHVGRDYKRQGSSQYAFLCLTQSSPEEVRCEVDMLLSDLFIRLKQLLFNSILCAYYVGFIPVQFADGHLYYDKWWCLEHTFLVWANSFVILSSHLLPPSYCEILYQCSVHLGCWARCSPHDDAHKWSPDVTWSCNDVVQWNSDYFKAEGPQNVAIPSNSSQKAFYVLFQYRLAVHLWLLILQIVIVAFQIVVLLRSVFWFQTLSMSVLLAFNSFILYRLLYNLLWIGGLDWIVSPH